MKFFIAMILASYVGSAFSYVDSQNCPESFVITYADVTPVALSKEIENDPFVKTSWQRLKGVRTLTYKFKITSRTNEALCVYASENSAAFLQTNDGVDELAVSFDLQTGLPFYFRTKVESFSPEHISVSNDEAGKKLLCPTYSFPETSDPIREVVVGNAKSVSIK